MTFNDSNGLSASLLRGKSFFLLSLLFISGSALIAGIGKDHGVSEGRNFETRVTDNKGFVADPNVNRRQVLDRAASESTMAYPQPEESPHYLSPLPTDDRRTLDSTSAEGCTIITSKPANQTACQGRQVKFSVTTSGPSPLFYNWFRGGTQLPGQHSSTLTISSVSQLKRDSNRS